MKISSLLLNSRLNSVTIFSAIIGITVFFAGTRDICSEVNKSISLGDAQQLSKYLCPMVEMSVLGKEGYFSKVQAVSILSEFFRNNPPKNFTVKPGGCTTENTKFSIGTYISTENAFKIYYVVKKEQENEFVRKLTIEKK
jgi:hypothetical protein